MQRIYTYVPIQEYESVLKEHNVENIYFPIQDYESVYKEQNEENIYVPI